MAPANILSRFLEYLMILVSRWTFLLSKSNTHNKILTPDSICETKSKTHNKILSSESICETVEGSHVYKIKGYSVAKGMGVGKFLTSRTLTVGGHDWVIAFYPHGDIQDREEYVSVFLQLVNTSNTGDVRAVFEFKLIDQSGKGEYGQTCISPYNTFDMAEINNHWGFQRFIKRSELESSSYLKDDCLIILCTVGVVQTRYETVENCVNTMQTRVDAGMHNVIPVTPSDMIQNLKGLLESGIGSDITFHVGDEFFRAHKLILAARSSVFKAQFFGSLSDPDMETVTIEEFEPFAFKAMLLFLYSDELPETCELSNSDSPFTSTTVIQYLLAAADRFDLTRLRNMCEEKLCEEITANTVATTLALAEQYQCQQLKSVCLNFVVKPENFGEVMKSDGYSFLEKSLLSDLLKTSVLVNKNEASCFTGKEFQKQ